MLICESIAFSVRFLNIILMTLNNCVESEDCVDKSQHIAGKEQITITKD